MVRHRRGNAGAGILLLLAGLAIAVSATQPWMQLVGPNISLGSEVVGVGVNPSVAVPVDEELQSMVAFSGIAVAVLACLLSVTRVRGLGVVWRLLALVVILLPALAAAEAWALIGDVEATEQSETTAVEQLGALMGDGLEALGLVTLEPTPGLFILTVGLVTALVGVLVPARRLQEWKGAPPQWEPSYGGWAPR